MEAIIKTILEMVHKQGDESEFAFGIRDHLQVSDIIERFITDKNYHALEILYNLGYTKFISCAIIDNNLESIVKLPSMIVPDTMKLKTINHCEDLKQRGWKFTSQSLIKLINKHNLPAIEICDWLYDNASFDVVEIIYLKYISNTEVKAWLRRKFPVISDDLVIITKLKL